MPRARPLRQDFRKAPLRSEDRALPLPSENPVIFMAMPSKKVTPGDRVYPFSGLVIDGPASTPASPGIASARWRKDGGSYTAISLGDFTDILSAIRFLNEVVNLYGTFFYEIEVTDSLGNVQQIGADVLSKITLGAGKTADRNVNFRPFADSIIAEDPSQILSIEYSVSGDTTVSKTAITRPLVFSGTHDGLANAAALTDTGRDFIQMGVRVGDIVRNTTDGSEAVITNVAATIITGVLSGGTDDDWDVSDVYNIVDGASLDLIARGFELSIGSAGFNVITLFVNDLSSNESSESITARIT